MVVDSLVVYFSASGVTEKVANLLSLAIGADLYKNLRWNVLIYIFPSFRSIL